MDYSSESIGIFRYMERGEKQMMHNRPRRILAFSLIMMLVLSVPAFALDAGLGSFGDVNQYTDEVFRT